ncbi:Zinc finger CCCH domain-containing protein 31 [Abeliophyllum distichum]|uniref:Zinc finger CCCH domain-containing protein 31 n=1 Tax=Abeliophyllum distichum TaxID=126358 RepID=A0ABD1QGJ5_9LAMI
MSKLDIWKYRAARHFNQTLHSLHHVLPKFLLIFDSLPSYYDPYVWHTCHLECEQKGETDALAVENEHLEVDSELIRCVAVPFAECSDSQMDNMTRNLALIIKEVPYFACQGATSLTWW